jgi:SAM-dependent methyltransferase
MAETKLNIGCGTDIRDGWINLDSLPLHGVSMVHDIERAPFPFEDGCFDTILCQDVLEHVEYIPVLRECYRILKKGGKLRIRVPHFSSRRNFDDPTHKKMFSLKTFEYFIEHSSQGRSYYFDFLFGRISFLRLTFEKKWYLPWNPVLEWTLNRCVKLRDTVFEATCLSRLFPADAIVVELIK